MTHFHPERPTRDYLLLEVTEEDPYDQTEAAVALYWHISAWLKAATEVFIHWDHRPFQPFAPSHARAVEGVLRPLPRMPGYWWG